MTYFWFSGQQFLASYKSKGQCIPKSGGYFDSESYDMEPTVCYVKTHEGEWVQYTERGSKPKPSGSWDDYHLVYKTELEPECRHPKFTTDTNERTAEIRRMLEIAGFTSTTPIRNDGIHDIPNDPYFYIDGCEHSHALYAGSSNGALARGCKMICMFDRNNPTDCIVDRTHYKGACSNYKGKGHVGTAAWDEKCHREAMCEFD